jgi:hypothetical protein
MPEGLSPVEAGKELKEHAERSDGEHDRSQDRIVSIFEALLLAVVAVLAAWSGYAAAKWGTESSLSLAQANAARSLANRASLNALNENNFDVTAFNAWFSAYVAGNQQAMALAAKRFTPNFRTAFDAWMATSPSTNPNAPPGPTYMPQYQQPELGRAAQLDAEATTDYAKGAKAASNSDGYIRTTVYLATVLFLAGIGSHFRYRAIRYGLAGVGFVILGLSIYLLATAPGLPG